MCFSLSELRLRSLIYSDLGWSKMHLTYCFKKTYIQMIFLEKFINKGVPKWPNAHWKNVKYFWYIPRSHHWKLFGETLLFQIEADFLITNQGRIITRWGSYHQSGQIYYKSGSHYKSVHKIALFFKKWG